jgi:hypothetical protein
VQCTWPRAPYQQRRQWARSSVVSPIVRLPNLRHVIRNGLDRAARQWVWLVKPPKWREKQTRRTYRPCLSSLLPPTRSGLQRISTISHGRRSSSSKRLCLTNAARLKQAENPLLVDLALQGGGSYGAFAGVVLDRLLEESRLRIEAISGTSAGAMNAAVLADGWTEGGAEGARLAIARGCIQPAATLSWAAGRSIHRQPTSRWIYSHA